MWAVPFVSFLIKQPMPKAEDGKTLWDLLEIMKALRPDNGLAARVGFLLVSIVLRDPQQFDQPEKLGVHLAAVLHGTYYNWSSFSFVGHWSRSPLALFHVFSHHSTVGVFFFSLSFWLF